MQTYLARKLAALVAAAGLSLSVSPAFAGIITYDEDPSQNLFGTLNQRAIPACGNNTTEDNSQACGPVAATNSFTYLEKKYPQVYGNKLTGGNPSQTANDLSGNNYMKCNCVPGSKGTTIGNFISGKEKFIDAKAPDSTTFEFQNFWQNFTTPDYNFLLTQVKNGQDVELLIGWYQLDADADYKRVGGHYLTVTGASFNDNNNDNVYDAGDTPNTLYYIDPWGTTQNGVNDAERSSSGLTIDTETIDTKKVEPVGDTDDVTRDFIVLNDYFTHSVAPGNYNDGTTKTKIEAVVAESPVLTAVPEPGTLWLTGSGLLGALFLARRRVVRAG